MQVRAVILATMLMLVPLGVRAADLVVWWEKAYYPRRTRRYGRPSPPLGRRPASRSSFTFYTIDELPGRASAAVEAGQPPDFAYGQDLCCYQAGHAPAWDIWQGRNELRVFVGPCRVP
jgi:hypothetical protein